MTHRLISAAQGALDALTGGPEPKLNPCECGGCGDWYLGERGGFHIVCDGCFYTTLTYSSMQFAASIWNDKNQEQEPAK